MHKNENIPDGWKKKRLDSVALVERGKFSARPRNDPQYYGGDIPFLQTGDVSNSTGYIMHYKQTLNPLGLSVSKLFPAGTLIITIAANIGDIAEVGFAFACPDSLVAIRPYKDVSNVWLKYLLHTKKPYFRSVATQNAQANINLEVIRPIKVVIPPLGEQRAISGVLGTWDDVIEKTTELIALKEKKFKWLLKSLISEQCTKDNEKSGWKKVKLGSLFGKEIRIEKGKALTKKTMEIGAVPVVAGGQSYAYHAKEPTHNMPTVTVSASGAYAGFIWFHDYPIWASDCNVLLAVDGSTKFLYFALKVLQNRIYALQSGGAQPHVYSKDMKNLMVPWPRPEVQRQIASTLSTAQKEIDVLKELVEKYKEQKKGLMQKLLTGVWRVATGVVKAFEEGGR